MKASTPQIDQTDITKVDSASTDELYSPSNTNQQHSCDVVSLEPVTSLVSTVISACVPANHFLSSLCEVSRYKSDIVRVCEYCSHQAQHNTDKSAVSASSLCLDCRDDLCDSCVMAHQKVTHTHLLYNTHYNQSSKLLLSVHN